MKPAKEEKRQQNQQNVYAGCADCKNLLGVSRSANKVSLFVFSLLILIPIILHIEQPKIISKRLVSCIKRKYKRNAKTPKSTSADLMHWKILFSSYLSHFSQQILLNNRNIPVCAAGNFRRKAVIFPLLVFLLSAVSSHYVPLGISRENLYYFPSQYSLGVYNMLNWASENESW